MTTEEEETSAKIRELQEKFVGKTIKIKDGVDGILDELDCMLEVGMMATVVSISKCRYSLSVDVVFEVASHLEHNRKHMTPCFFDKEGHATLTWEKSCHYPKNGHISQYFNLDDELTLESVVEIVEEVSPATTMDWSNGSKAVNEIFNRLKACQDISDETKRLQAFDSLASYVIGQKK